MATNKTNPSVASELASWIGNFDKTLKNHPWIPCPICSEPWTKLRPCVYLWEGQQRVTNVCIRCAESTQALEFIAEQLPVHGTGIEFKWHGKPSTRFKLGGEWHTEDFPHNRYARVTYLGRLFILTSKATGPHIGIVSDQGPGVQWADNAYAAWSMIALDIEKGPDRQESLLSDENGPKASNPGKRRFGAPGSNLSV